MDMLKLINQLKIDEGKKLVVYRDSLGFPTVGVGHLVLKKDGLKVGDIITEEQCSLFLSNDLESTIKNCYRLFPNFNTFLEGVQQILANMMFNLGYGGLSQFKKLIKAVNEKNYKLASESMAKSVWYTQVGNRAKRLVNEMKNIV